MLLHGLPVLLNKRLGAMMLLLLLPLLLLLLLLRLLGKGQVVLLMTG
jgi:hypothetical protein